MAEVGAGRKWDTARTAIGMAVESLRLHIQDKMKCMSDWQPLGKHRIRVDGDVIFWEVHGATQLDEIQRFYEVAEEVLSRHSWVALSVDLQDSSIPSAAARRYVADWERKHLDRKGVVIFYGASAPLRSIGSLIKRGIDMLTPKRNSLVFWVATAADALAVIAAHRPKAPSNSGA